MCSEGWMQKTQQGATSPYSWGTQMDSTGCCPIPVGERAAFPSLKFPIWSNAYISYNLIHILIIFIYRIKIQNFLSSDHSNYFMHQWRVAENTDKHIVQHLINIQQARKTAFCWMSRRSQLPDEIEIQHGLVSRRRLAHACACTDTHTLGPAPVHRSSTLPVSQDKTTCMN